LRPTYTYYVKYELQYSHIKCLGVRNLLIPQELVLILDVSLHFPIIENAMPQSE
jgi:hypothetical protein